ncbi:MAG: hypothetical protein WBG54_23445 [Acidobacteriaceae bacterium]
MLNEEQRAKVQKQIANLSDAYQQAKNVGYNVTTLALPGYENQSDHDLYHPDDAGSDYRTENEFSIEILKGLVASGVPARLATVRYDDYLKWLNGRPNTSSNRSAYAGQLAAREERGR